MAAVRADSTLASGRISGLFCSFCAEAELRSQTMKCSAIGDIAIPACDREQNDLAADAETNRVDPVMAVGTAADLREQQSERSLPGDAARARRHPSHHCQLRRSRPAVVSQPLAPPWLRR